MQSILDLFDVAHLDSTREWLLNAAMRQRSPIVDVLQCGTLVCAVTQSGLAALFQSSRFVCYLNARVGECIRSVVFDSARASLIISSTLAESKLASLAVRRVHLQTGLVEPLFDSESLAHPGFVQFGEQFIITRCGTRKTFRVWRADSCALMCEFEAEGEVAELKLYESVALLVHERNSAGQLPLSVVELSTGRVIRKWKHPLHRVRL